MSLDEKLDKVLYSTVVGVVAKKIPTGKDLIEQIKQAFVDEGWVSPEKVDEVGKQQLDFGHRWGMMTGKEWYQKWINETAGEIFAYSGDEQMKLVISVSRFFNDAAKRASGLEEKA